MSRADIKAELEAFIKSGKATSEVNSGNFVTTHIDVLKVAEHFYEQAVNDIKTQLNKRYEDYKYYWKCNRTPYYEGGCDSLDVLEQDIDEMMK